MVSIFFLSFWCVWGGAGWECSQSALLADFKCMTQYCQLQPWPWTFGLQTTFLHPSFSETLHLLTSISPFLHLHTQPLANAFALLASEFEYFRFHMWVRLRIILCSCVWLVSLSIMSSAFTHVVTRSRVAFSLVVECSTVRMHTYAPRFLHPLPIDGNIIAFVFWLLRIILQWAWEGRSSLRGADCIFFGFIPLSGIAGC